MISKISKTYQGIALEFEIEYTGTDTIKLVITENDYYILPIGSTETNYITLTLPNDFEKMCLVENYYSVLSISPDTITFDNGKECKINFNSIFKYLDVENQQLAIKDQPISTTRQDFISGMEVYKIGTLERLQNESDIILKEKLQSLINEIDFVIQNTHEDEKFPYLFYKFENN
jgi:hypothetical protein